MYRVLNKKSSNYGDGLCYHGGWPRRVARKGDIGEFLLLDSDHTIFMK